MQSPNPKKSPWRWVSTLYFAQGLPYVVVMTMAVIFYKRMGLSNTDIALYTGWLYLPWVIKPLWSPVVELIKSKRWWVCAMQSLIAVGFAGIALSIPSPLYLRLSLAFLWLLAFASATHDIAADGFYLLGLSESEQSFFVGIRNTFYRLATIFGQGILVMLAGLIEEGYIFPQLKGEIATAWSITFGIAALLFVILFFYHRAALPYPTEDVAREEKTTHTTVANKLVLFWKDFFATFNSYFQQKEIGFLLFFILTYRLGEAQLVKIASPFLLDTISDGGLALTTTAVGFLYGTVGVVALLMGGIFGGILVSRDGLKRWMIPMVLAINLPDLLYIALAYTQSTNFWVVLSFVAIEQLGYGFGFAAYMLVLIYAAKGKHKTAHYAIGTGLMALGMMLPGMAAGWVHAQLGYTWFFVWVVLCTLPGIVATCLIRSRIDASFGGKKG